MITNLVADCSILKIRLDYPTSRMGAIRKSSMQDDFFLVTLDRVQHGAEVSRDVGC